MPNPENIEKHKYKKGQSGNPNGRPKLPDLKSLIEDMGEDNIKAVVEALYKQAKKGNVKAIQEVLDRYYGKSQQSIDISTKGESLNKKVDLSKLTEEELREYAALQSKLEGN